MPSVRIYYAGIPSKNTNQEKRLVLENFHIGVPNNQSTEVENFDWQPSDLAVMQGWVHANSGNAPHLNFRKKIINNQKKIKKHTLAIDSNLFLYKDPNNLNQYLRFSLNDVFPTSGIYFTKNIDASRWSQIQRDLNINVKEWRTSGNYILICLQRNGGWSMGGLDVMKWLDQTIKNIELHSDRPIVVRAHPGDKKANQYLKINHPRVSISTSASIVQDLEHAWACVTFNSSPGVASAIEGVPVFVTDPQPEKSQAYDVCNINLSSIEKPKMPDRQSWLEKISMSHFNFNDLKTGKAWNIIREYL